MWKEIQEQDKEAMIVENYRKKMPRKHLNSV